MHLAALLPDGEAIALQLCTVFGAKQWLSAAADDGLTPAQFAMRAGKHALHKAITSIALDHPKQVAEEYIQAVSDRAVSDKVVVTGRQKRACPAEYVSVVPKKQKAAEEPKQAAAGWTSTTSSDSSSSSSGEEDCCISEPHVVSQLSGLPGRALAENVPSFVQSQKQRLAAVCRLSGWRPFTAGSVLW